MANLPQVGLEAVIAGMGAFQSAAGTILSTYDRLEKGASNVAKTTTGSFVSLGDSVLNFGANVTKTALIGIGALTAGIVGLGAMALSETAKYERMSLSINNLVAREISQGQIVEQQKQVLAGLTKKETEELSKLKTGLDNEINDRDVLTARIQEQKERIRQLTDQYGENGLVVIKERAELQGMELDLTDLNQEITDHQNKITTLTGKEDQMVTVMEKVRVGQMSMTDAMTKAGPKAQELLKWIQILAIQSPFTQEGIADAFRTVLAYGFTTDAAQRLTSAMVDFTAATGKSEQSAQLIALALGQIQARGKLSAQELRQLSEQGVGVNAILERMGFSLDDVTNGLVPVDAFLEAVIQDMEIFKGAAKSQSNTLAGLQASLGDLKSIALREFFTSTFSSIRPYVADFVNWLTKAALETGEIKKMGESLGQYVGGALRSISEYVRLIGTLGTGSGLTIMVKLFGPEGIALWKQVQVLMANLTLSWNTLHTILVQTLPPFSSLSFDIIPAITSGLAFLNEHFAEFQAALVGIGAILAVGVFASLVAGILALLTPINLIIAGTALLSAAWVGNWGGVQTTILSTWAIIQPVLIQAYNWLQTNLPLALKYITNLWNSYFPTIAATVLTAWTVIQAVFNAIVQGLNASVGPAITQIGTAFSSLGITWSDVGNALLQAAGIVFAAIGALILGVISVITGLVGAVASGVGTMVQFWGYLMTIVSQTVGGLMAVITSLQVFWTAIFAGDIPLALQAAGTGIAGLLTVVTGIVAGIVTAIVGMGATIYSFFAGFVNTVIGFWQGLFDTLVGHSIIPDMVDKIVEILTGENWFEIGVSMINGVLEGIEKNKAKVWEVLKDMAKMAIKQAGEAIGWGSPAKKFVPLGESIIQGLMIGVDNESQEFKNKLGNTLQSAIGLTQGLIESGMAGNAVRQMIRNVFKTVMTSTNQLGQLTGESLAQMVRTQLAQFGYNIAYVEEVMRSMGYNYEEMAQQLNDAHSDLMRELRLEAMGQSIGKANQFLSLGQAAADRLQSRIDTLRGLVESEGGEYLGMIYTTVEAQNALNAALAEQASVQSEINALAQQQADLQFLQQQVDLLKMVQDSGLNPADIFQGITFGLDASLPDLITATSNVVNAMIDQINTDLQIGSPSKVMVGKFKQVGAGMVQGLVSTIPAIQGAMNRIIDVPLGQANTSNVSNQTVNNNYFNLGVTTTSTPQATLMGYQNMRAMLT